MSETKVPLPDATLRAQVQTLAPGPWRVDARSVLLDNTGDEILDLWGAPEQVDALAAYLLSCDPSLPDLRAAELVALHARVTELEQIITDAVGNRVSNKAYFGPPAELMQAHQDAATADAFLVQEAARIRARWAAEAAAPDLETTL